MIKEEKGQGQKEEITVLIIPEILFLYYLFNIYIFICSPFEITHELFICESFILFLCSLHRSFLLFHSRKREREIERVLLQLLYFIDAWWSTKKLKTDRQNREWAIVIQSDLMRPWLYLVVAVAVKECGFRVL